ncbi:Non-classical phosphatidylinositol transfer protein (PITP) [Coemansia erecta]|uniref:Non-classical phosphatidylinositol transfer protein (PITP) n=1 Tax=Coemansia erecta TaxID=147472 RepID=A0A9W7Y4S8_9FUNG|nr:Non-classical phosphatidylinositol transfer protein (PITP) [Coemansia erecta]
MADATQATTDTVVPKADATVVLNDTVASGAGADAAGSSGDVPTTTDPSVPSPVPGPVPEAAPAPVTEDNDDLVESLQSETKPLGKAQHFSESQKEAIHKLREQLPEIVKEAEDELGKAIEPSLWGVPLVSPDGTDAVSRDLRVDVILHKFIKARNGDVTQAREMLKNTLVWRVQFDVANILEEKFPEDVFSKVGYVYGHDREGRPVTYNSYGNLDNASVFGNLDRFLRWRVQLHERGMRMLDFVDVADMVQVHDYDGVGLLSYDKSARAASKATVQLMSDNYPETLATKIFANVPGWGETIFNIICRWLSEETKSKFVVVSKSSAARVLAERIGAENLPPVFAGGKSDAQTAAASASASAPQPETAHVDPAENAPKPTDAAQPVSSEPPGAAAPAEPVVTAMPEQQDAAYEDDIADTTAGMRLDDETGDAASKLTEPGAGAEAEASVPKTQN